MLLTTLIGHQVGFHTFLALVASRDVSDSPRVLLPLQNLCFSSDIQIRIHIYIYTNEYVCMYVNK